METKPKGEWGKLTTSTARVIALLAGGSDADEDGEEREDGETHGD